MAKKEGAAPADGRPKFAQDFPKDPELDALVDAFAKGNFARVREGAPELARKTEDENVKQAALLLRSRIEADPIAIWLIVLTGAVLLFLAVWWVMHGKAPANAPAPAVTIERVK